MSQGFGNFRRLLALGVLAGASILLLLALSSGDSKAQWVPNTPQFQPVFEAKLCNDLKPTFKGPADLKGGGGTCTPVTATGANPDITTPFTVPAGYLAYDQGYFVAAGGANETRLDGAAIGGPNPDGTGAAAGGLESTVTLGLVGNPCNDTIHPDFIWWEAEYSVTDTVACQSEGVNDRWSTMATDGGDAFPGQADRNSPIVIKYPDCIMRMFDPDGDGIDTDGNPATIGDQPVQPRARFAGLTQVPPGADWQMLNNVEFDPGALKAAFLANPGTTRHPYAKLDASLGFTNVVVLNDPTTVILQPNTISDFCTALATKGMLKGRIDTNGDTIPDINRVTSPGVEGSYMVQMRTQSYRDADGDGIENNFDTCVWTANTAAEDPYSDPGPDTDMLDSACDPYPNAKDDDEDNDYYLNAQDYCPLVQNISPDPPYPATPGPGEWDSENAQLYNVGAPDGGPRQDAIGDTCDSEEAGSLGDTVSDGLYFNAIHVDSVCITDGGKVDSDGDGWCNDKDPNDADANNPGQMTHVMVDKIGNPDLDSDGDGYDNVTEWAFLGTDPASDCAFITGHDAWPPDFDMNKVVNILDVGEVLPPYFGMTSASPGWEPRRDLQPSGAINILDVGETLPPNFGKPACTAP